MITSVHEYTNATLLFTERDVGAVAVSATLLVLLALLAAERRLGPIVGGLVAITGPFLLLPIAWALIALQIGTLVGLYGEQVALPGGVAALTLTAAFGVSSMFAGAGALVRVLRARSARAATPREGEARAIR